MPTWSPDGTHLAAVAGATDTCGTPDSGTMDAFVMSADGSDLQSLAAQAGVDEWFPSWSPDKTRITFQRQVDEAEWFNDRPCTVRDWIANADGTNPQMLEGLGPDLHRPAWSPDGTRIFDYIVDPDTSLPHLAILTLDGSSPTAALPDVGMARWQPVPAPLPPAPSFGMASAAP